MSEHIRIEVMGDVANNGKVIHVAADGTETDISRCCTGFTFHGEVGHLNRATLDVIRVQGLFEAEHFVVGKFRRLPGRFPRVRQKLRDVTAVGDRWRRFQWSR